MPVNLKRPFVNLELTAPKHGGDLAYWQRKVGNDALNWLDLSSACNREPWPIPEIPASLWMDLPDQTDLLDEAERYFGRRPTAIGAGSQHIIESLPALLRESGYLTGQTVLVPRIGYQEHAFAWQKWGYDIAYYDALEELLTQQWVVAVVIQPNNPTGEIAPAKILSQLIAHAEQQGASLVVDEAFIDASPELSVLHQQKAADLSESLFVMRSVGKFFGLAGARVGFVFCAPKWQAALKNLLGPWPVATPSLHLVCLAFADQAWQSHALQDLKVRQAAFVERVMPKLNTIFDSQDSVLNPLFITWFLDRHEDAAEVFEMLHQVGVHTRLGEGWIRVALPALDEMDALNSALIRLLKGAAGSGYSRGELA
ncbi:aminotransferase class I/II-fold pyridoxal phosphate-dependent enzyme [Marinomonas sp. M1K-6]|uniref:Aminotransferase n=1 Tax=Marinomonas profundi TaxID=2726122 RepID=A0A847RA79_9GAMM|nr:aminotransferase class I/II-fold pyridoxal phosphate-dependent enzyme [Marinomonas profundi]NLQ18077.1 aminotransferase class I/II-fold pyridoxal phosphate-dependent enzyme [Marinomonas profundi]UDV04137.1 aminotransferase class I/II-fold pyridoxal phosphate-dependent enzyme [Marinomonas profundi]